MGLLLIVLGLLALLPAPPVGLLLIVCGVLSVLGKVLFYKS